jgi:hypothetical protein
MRFCRFCRFCGAWLGVDEEPRGGWAAALWLGGVGVDAAEPAVFFQQGEGWF